MVSIGRNNIQSLSLSNKVVINDEAVSQQKVGITTRKPAFPEPLLKTRKFENEQGVADAINKSEVDIGGIVQIGDCEYCIVGWSTDKDGKAIPPIQLGSPDQPVGGYGRLK